MTTKMSCKIVLPAGDIFRLVDFPKSLSDLRANILQRYSKKLPSDFTLAIEKKPNLPEILENEVQFTMVTSKLKPEETLKIFVKETSELKQESVKLKQARSMDNPRIFSDMLGFENIPKVKSEIISFCTGNEIPDEMDEMQGGGEFTPSQMKCLERMIDKRLEQLEDRLKSYIESQMYALLRRTQQEKKTSGFFARQRDAPESWSMSNVETTAPHSLKGTMVSENSLLPKIELNQYANNTSGAVSLSVLGGGGAKIKRVARNTSNINEEHKSVVALVQQDEKKRPTSMLVGLYICDGCRMNPLVGPHYKCKECADFDYCQNCQKTKPHQHALFLITEEEEKTEVMNIQRSINTRKSWIAVKNNASQLVEAAYKKDLAQSVIVEGNEDLKPGFRRSATNTQDTEAKKEVSTKPFRAKLVHEPQNPIPNISPAKSYEITFTLKNTGEFAWPANTEICCLGGCHFGIAEKLKPISPGEELEITLPLQAPNSVGQFSSSWKLRYPAGDTIKQFGPKLTFEIQVEDISKGHDQSRIQLENLESKFSPDVVRKAKFLQEMFQGDLRQHLDFVSNCKSTVSVDEIVELYLQAETTTGGK